MALPSTNLTAHWDASTNTYLRAALNPGSPRTATGTVSHAGQVAAWLNKVNTDQAWIKNTNVAVYNPADIAWKDDTVLTLPSIEIVKGTMSVEQVTNATTLQTSDWMTASAKTMAFSFMLTDKSKLTNNATAYLNSTLLGTPKNNYFSTHLRNNGGTVTLYVYNWDGSADTISFTILEDTTYVLVITHDGANLNAWLRVDSGGTVSETTGGPTASGNTTTSVTWRMSDSNQADSEQTPIRIGEIALYNAALTGTTLAELKTYLNRWLYGNAVNTVVGSSVFGTNGSVGTSRVQLLNLDNVTRTITSEGMQGSLVLGGYFALAEQTSAPAGVDGYVFVWAEDNGSGKLRIMAQFPTGSAQQISIEP